MLARHVHLPVQSGSDRVLKRMIRRYTRAEYVERAERLTRRAAGLDALHRHHRRLPGRDRRRLRGDAGARPQVGFVSLFGFKYSPRPHTPALKLADDVPEAVKSERLARLFELAEALGARAPREPRRHEPDVLVEGAQQAEKGDRARNRVQGRTERNEIVHIDCGGRRMARRRDRRGQIARANRHSVAGMVEPDESRRSRSRGAAPREARERGAARRSLPGTIEG